MVKSGELRIRVSQGTARLLNVSLLACLFLATIEFKPCPGSDLSFSDRETSLF